MTPLRVEFLFSKGAQNTRPARVSDHLGLQASESTDTPIYLDNHILHLWNTTWDALYVQLFFPTNPGYCCGLAGRHPADVERIVVLRDQRTLIPVWVYFSAHGNGQGMWRRWHECRFTPCGTLQVFVSRQSNALYPEPATYWRVLGLANDVADGRGSVFRPRRDDFCDAMAQAWADSHLEVAQGIRSPSNPSPPPERGADAWERILLAFPCVKSRVANTPQAKTIV